jgi:hypothetical protein
MWLREIVTKVLINPIIRTRTRHFITRTTPHVTIRCNQHYIKEKISIVKCYDLRWRRRKYSVFLRLLNIVKLTNSCDDPSCEIGGNSSFYGTGRFFSVFTGAFHWTLFWIHSTFSRLILLRLCYIIPESTISSDPWSESDELFRLKFRMHFSSPHACNINPPCYFILLDMITLISQIYSTKGSSHEAPRYADFSPASSYFLSLWSKRSSSHFVLTHLILLSSLRVSINLEGICRV